ncbi:hypothetical protein Poli38472_005221 [Pythium oligandrum]|uniref:Guanylate cyclase domain-containing protein n=1 Tax=Pythium oligandrum TaxID=41045 RepID=A0A8K1CHJ5_PYTOL|nr:hypothetical protein Poli38472_005221 [Pythium oligandrum]|eukprot:TMW62603.1 hypothetical protein Poli38472_005221 [Pythium oligandrum]
MDPQTKELSVLVRHVPRIVISHFLRHPERLREPESTPFTAVVALFDISGFSSLGSKLSDDERDQIKASNTATKVNDQELEDGRGPRLSLPLEVQNNTGRHTPGPGTFGTRTSSLRFSARDVNNAMNNAHNNGHNTEDMSERSDSVPRDLMRQRRQSTLASPSAAVNGSRIVSFVSRAKPAAPQGLAVETLTTTLNKTLEPVIDVILKHGGDIIKFAGDALIVVWETEASQGEPTAPGILVYRAVKCALEGLRVLTATSLRHGHTSILGMHVGIGVSKVTGNHVGGVLDRWEFYLSGDANRQMSEAEQDAGKGEVALSKEAFAAVTAVQSLLNVKLDTDETAKGNFLVHSVSRSSHVFQPPPDLLPSLDLIPFLRGYVPGTISSYLRKGLAINPCSRNVTAVFVRLDGVIEITEEKDQLLFAHKALCLVQESAYKVQGTLRQFVIDDKGAVAIIAIGLPPYYHENNALRGVKLASYLLDKGLRASIGVTTGSAFCGSVGSHIRAEYAVVGDVINLAARLMSAAGPGEIFCDELTHDEAKDSMEYHDPVEIPVKGKSHKVKVFQVRRQAQSKTKLDATTLLDAVHGLPYGSEYLVESAPLFGSGTARSDRRTTINERYPQQHHRVLIITGESGTGKTMFLRHFQHAHARSFMGSGDPVDYAMDFHAWSGIMREMLGRTIKTPKITRKSSHDSNNERPESPSGDNDALVQAEAIMMTDTQSDGSVASSVNFPINTQQGFEARLSFVDKASQNSSGRGRNELESGRSPLRLMSSLTGTYERVPVMDYLVMKGRIAQSMVPIMNDLLPYDQLFQGSLELLDKGEERTKALEILIFSVLEAISAYKPILLIFDNAQWMDGLSWTLLLRALEELPNVNALIATRSQHRIKRQAAYELLEQLPYVKKQEMRRFNYQVTSLFLCQQYHIAIMDTQALDFVFARTDGNPAELLRLMNFMIESKYISIDHSSGNIAILSDLDDLDMQVPEYTRAKVMSCIDALDGLAQMALKVICIHPEPVDEKMLYGILTLFLTSEHGGGSEKDVRAIRPRRARSNSALAFLLEVRLGLAECEKEAIVTLDEQTKLVFFNSEEMRLVVYDTMLPSQREMIHLLYCTWFKDVTRHAARASTSLLPAPGPSSITSAVSESCSASPLDQTQETAPRLQQQYAMLGYHLARSGSAKSALEAYQKAAEHALEGKDLVFATDCMQSSFKILDDGPRGSKLSELDYILLRSKIEFLRGAIAIEKSEWDLAIMHMSYIVRLCQRKGSVLRRYSSSIFRNESILDTSIVLGKAPSIGPSIRTASGVARNRGLQSGGIPQLHLPMDDSTWYEEMQARCLPKLFNFQRLIPWGYPASLFVTRRARRQSRGSTLSRSNSNTGRVQPEETLMALNQVHFYKKKAEVLIKKIMISKRKQEEMSREIQRLTQKSLQTKQKR